MSVAVSPAAIDAVLDDLIDSGYGETEGGERLAIGDFAVSRSCARVLEDAAAAAPAGASVEVGCASGASTLAICKGRLRAGHGGQTVHVIDPGQDLYVSGTGRRTIERAGVGAMVRLHEAYDHEALPLLLADGVRAGFVFLDGNHVFDSVMLDLYYAQKMLAAGGVIVLHDLWMPAVQHAAAFWAANLPVEPVSVSDAGLSRAAYSDGGGGAGDPEQWPAGFGERLAPYVRATTLVLRATGDDSRRWDHFEAFA